MSLSSPLNKQLDTDLQGIRSNISRMGGLAEAQLRGAIKMFIESDVSSVAALMDGDHAIDQLELDIDLQCANLIARRQPVAIDLRAVVVISKMVTDLERIGDESKKIARSTAARSEWPLRETFAREIGIELMGHLAADLLHASLDAYARLDADMAESALRLDNEIDTVYRSACRRLTEQMILDPQTTGAALNLFSAGKSLERIGDHAKKIAKYVIYIVSGRDVRHLSLARS